MSGEMTVLGPPTALRRGSDATGGLAHAVIGGDIGLDAKGVEAAGEVVVGDGDFGNDDFDTTWASTVSGFP